MKEFYYGDFSDIYNEVRVLDASEFIPLYSDDHNINETLYFDAFDSDGNWYYFNSHLFAQNTSAGVYDITFNPEYNEEYYLRYVDSQGTQRLADLYDSYIPHIANFSYLYISWADANAWKEWRTIATPNINISTLDLTFEWYNDTLEEYESVSYNQTLSEFEARNIAVETLYPFTSTGNDDIFNLSQSYSNAQNLDIMMIKGYYFNESSEDFDPSNSNFKFNFKTLNISAPNRKNLYNFEKIVVYINFTEGAYSDYTQFKLLDNAITNHSDTPTWTKNDTLYVDYEYQDINYFLLMEEYTVGSEDSMFELFNYTRNDKYVIQDPEDSSYSLEMAGQYENFQNFTKENDLKTVLEFLDFDEDGTHELVVQKDDITGDGFFDSFKYGFVNPAGEITFHTLVQEVKETQVQKDKKSDVTISEKFSVYGDWNLFLLGYEKASVQRIITTNSTIETTIDRMTTLIQKDLDYDGNIDKEVSYEEVYTITNTIVYTEEVNNLKWYEAGDPFKINPYYATLTEYRNSTYTSFDMSISYVFRDFDSNKLISTRYYDDVFPNELSEVYNLDKNLHTIINDMGDTDPSNDIISQVPAIDQLLDLRHPRDGVSAIFDRKITVNNSYSPFSEDVKTEIVAENFLTTQKEISIPGSYNEGSGIANYMTDEHITLDVIEVIPTEGVYYDNSEGYNPEKLKGLGYSYYFFDEDNDGKATMIFVVDSKGEVKAVGFDYDGNAIFNPRETLLTERHIISKNIVQAGISQMLKHFIKNDLITFGDGDTYEGVFSVPTFRDPLFDIWKSQYNNGTSILMREVKKMTADRFIQSLSVAKVSIEILTQVSTQYSAFVVGQVAGMGLGTYLPVVGHAIGFLAGYFVTYVYLNTIVAWAKQKDLDSYIKSQTAHNPYYEGEKILSTVSDYDYYGSVMTDVLQGSPRGKYAEVKVETGKYEFKGQVILAPKGEDKTSNYGKTFTDIDLDYSQQTRSYLMYSDFGPRLDPFLTTTTTVWDFVHVEGEGLVEVESEEEVPNPEFYYMENSIMYLENAIHQETSSSAEEETRHYDRIIPYMNTYVPSLQFASSDGPFYLPEFYLDYPIFVSSENYEDVKDEVHKIYKVYDGENSVQLLPDEYAETRKLMSDIISVNAHYLDSLSNKLLIDIYTEEDYEFNPITGELSFSDTLVETLNNFIVAKRQTYDDIINYDGWIILEVHIEKFRNISSTEQYQVEITPEIANKIATAQSSHASILEYLYQYTIAEDTQQKLDQISYTVWLTIATTLITIGLAAGTSKLISAALPVSTGTVVPSSSKVVNFLNKIVSSKSYQIAKVGLAVFSESMEEVYVDPWIEAFVTKAVRDAGGSGFQQILWSSMAESGRESLVSGVTSVLGSYSTSSQIRTQLQTERALAGTSQDSRTTITNEQRKLFAERQQQEEQLRSERIGLITSSISSILMFAGALSGGIFGSGGTSLGNLLILSSVGVDLSKDVFELALKTKQENVGTLDIYSDVSDVWKSRIVREVEARTVAEINTLSDDQKNSDRLWAVMDKYYEEVATNPFLRSTDIFTGGIRSGIQFSPYVDYSGVAQRKPTLSLAAQMIVPIIDLVRSEKPGLAETEYAKELGMSYPTFADWAERIKAMTDLNRDIKSHMYHDSFRRIRLAIKRNFPTAQTSGQMAQLISTYTQAYYGNENFWLGIIDIFDKYSTDRIVPIKTLTTALRRYSGYISKGLIEGADKLRSNKFPGRFFDILTRISLLEPSDLNLENPNDLVNIKKECRQYIFEAIQSRFSVPDGLQGRFDMIVDSLVAFTKSRRKSSGNNKYTMQLSDLSKIVSRKGASTLLSDQLLGNRGKSRILRHYRQAERLVIALRKEFFGAPKENHKAIGQLKIYMRDMFRQTRRFRKYNPNFAELKTPQMKELIDITMGLDVYAKDFLKDAIIGVNKFMIPQIVMEMTRHHILQDPDYYLIFGLYDDIFSFRLAPVSFASNTRIHKSLTSDFGQTSDLIVARLMHLYELVQKSFVRGTDYKTFFEKEFRNKEAYIFGRGDLKIWNGIRPDVVAKYAERWVMFKDPSNSESVFYNNYYSTFYNRGYKWFMNDYKMYLNEDPNTSYPEFWYWHSTVYLPQSIYPFLDSLKWNQE